MSQPTNEMLPFLTRKDIDGFINNLARKIESDYEGQELIMICPLKGSIHFIADLMRRIRLPQRVDFVSMSSTEKGGSVRMTSDISISVTGKHVLIIEEIIDSGRKLSFLKSRILASNPASLKIVTLLDKPARRDLPIRADYIGKVIDDRYLIGYGMDSEEVGRNLPDIYTLKN